MKPHRSLRPTTVTTPRRVISLTTTLWLCLIAAGCAVDRDREISIGQEARAQFEQKFGGLYPDRDVQQYVQEVGAGLARNTGRADLPWQFAVLDSDEVNAFALPGGLVYITRGLLFKMEDEAQLAAVLAHEAAHVAHRDSVRQLERTQVLQGGALLAGLLGGGSVVGDAGQLVAGLTLMSYSREQEKQADLSGLQYLAREKYDPRAMVRVMEILKASGGGAAGQPQFLSSHPAPEAREEYLTQAIRQQYADIVGTRRTGRLEFDRRILAKAPSISPDTPIGTQAGYRSAR